MAEKSIFWSTTGTGDGTAGGYTMADLINWLRRTFNSDNFAAQGPLAGYNNQLAVTAAAPNVTIATGAAYVYGYPYENDAVVSINIPTPSAATRIDRIVLRASWAAQTVRITRIAGTEGAGAPAITQTPGTTYDVPLAQVSITTGGVITVTDERQFCHFASRVAAENIDDGIITDAKIATGAAIAQSKISNSAPAINADQVDGYHAGNSSGQVPVSNGTVNTDLNADQVDGKHASNTANNVPVLDASALLPLAQIPATLTGKSADQVDGYHAGTGASQVLVLDSGGKVPLANLPVYAKEIHIPLCYERARNYGAYGAVHAGYWTFDSSKFLSGFTAYFEVVWSAAEGAGGTNLAKVALRNITDSTDAWSSTLATPVAERRDRNAVTLTNGKSYQVWGNGEQDGQAVTIHEAKIVLVW